MPNFTFSLVATKANAVLLAVLIVVLASGVTAYVHHAQVEERAREVAVQQELARQKSTQALADKKAAEARLGEQKAAAFFAPTKTEFRWNDAQPTTPAPQPKHP